MTDSGKPWQITSVASMAIYLVIVCGMLLLPLAIVAAFLAYLVGFETPLGNAMRLAVLALWILIVIAMWRHFVIKGRSWPNPQLDTREFFFFQVAAAVCVAGFGSLLRIIPHDVPVFVTALRTFFDVIIVALIVAYFTLAWGIRCKVPIKTYMGGTALLVAIAMGRML